MWVRVAQRFKAPRLLGLTASLAPGFRMWPWVYNLLSKQNLCVSYPSKTKAEPGTSDQ